MANNQSNVSGSGLADGQGDSTLQMLRSKPRLAYEDPARNYLFRVSFPSGGEQNPASITADMSLACRKVSNLRRPIDVIVHRDGRDWQSERKIPGHVRNEPVTLEQPIIPGMSNDEVANWIKAMYHQDSPGGPISNEFRRTILIEQLHHTNLYRVVQSWTLHNAWLSEVIWGDFDAMGNDIQIRSITIQHEGIEYEIGAEDYTLQQQS